MESNVYSLRKTRPVEVPVASTLSPESEMSGNTPCTRSSSLETALPRINSEPHLPARQDPCYDSLVLSEVGKDTKNIGVGLELSDQFKTRNLWRHSLTCGKRRIAQELATPDSLKDHSKFPSFWKIAFACWRTRFRNI